MVALRLHEKILGKKDFRLEKKIFDSRKKFSTRKKNLDHFCPLWLVILILFCETKRNETKQKETRRDITKLKEQCRSISNKVEINFHEDK